MRTAILFDTRYVRLNDASETDFPRREVDGEPLFDRQALYAHFTLLYQGQDMNDLAVCAVHLASKQSLVRNHDEAMRLITRELARVRDDNWVIPEKERDILIGGDLNANRFDNYRESFWDLMEANGWDVLADEEDQYPATRLSGTPLQQRNSRIDYLIVTAGEGGLAGDEIGAATAKVNDQLINRPPFNSSPDKFREHASDHIPVTVRVRVKRDDD